MYGFESEGTIRALSEYVSQPDDSEKAGILLAGAKPAPELSPAETSGLVFHRVGRKSTNPGSEKTPKRSIRLAGKENKPESAAVADEDTPTQENDQSRVWRAPGRAC